MAQATVATKQELKTAHLYDIEVTIGSHADLGQTPHGNRQIFSLSGGKVEGPRLKGIVEPVGADWAIARPDGTLELDVRLQIRTDDGEVIYCTYHGFLRASHEVGKRLFGGESVEPSEYYMRSAPRFETGSQKYAWLNSVIAVGVGQVDLKNGIVRYRVYEIQ